MASIDFKARSVVVAGQLSPEGTLTTTKTTASAAAVPLLPQLATELRDHRSRLSKRDPGLVRRDALVFVTGRGRPQSRRNALRAIHHAGDEAGLNPKGREKIGLHDLRHSFVAIALASGFTLPEAAALARHASPRVTAAL